MRSPLQTQRRKGTQEKGSQGRRQSFLRTNQPGSRIKKQHKLQKNYRSIFQLDFNTIAILVMKCLKILISTFENLIAQLDSFKNVTSHRRRSVSVSRDTFVFSQIIYISFVERHLGRRARHRASRPPLLGRWDCDRTTSLLAERKKGNLTLMCKNRRGRFSHSVQSWQSVRKHSGPVSTPKICVLFFFFNNLHKAAHLMCEQL